MRFHDAFGEFRARDIHAVDVVGKLVAVLAHERLARAAGCVDGDFQHVAGVCAFFQKSPASHAAEEMQPARLESHFHLHALRHRLRDRICRAAFEHDDVRLSLLRRDDAERNS